MIVNTRYICKNTNQPSIYNSTVVILLLVNIPNKGNGLSLFARKCTYYPILLLQILNHIMSGIPILYVTVMFSPLLELILIKMLVQLQLSTHRLIVSMRLVKQ